MQLHQGKRFLFFFFSCVFFFPCHCQTSAEGWAMPLQYSREELSRVAGYGEEPLSSVLVAGTVVCDVCLQGETEFRTSYVQGAKVAVRCKTEDMKKNFSWAHGRTDEYGDFTVDLPSQLHATPNLESACMVRVVRAPRASPCRGVRLRSKSTVKLSSVGNSIRVYSAGIIRLESYSTSSSTAGLCMRRRSDGSESMW
ncbi:hypothetical protein Taro_040756 [Colocasia esculenta]|uniref:Pollen Ole e 1 allergen and extensin family protein n=1 Tax=Colocasia esculenta TaxID=4460 RepID=A0A843WVG3_COLES|nr:hypothetical protein [Colocasia esculenta]